MDPMSDIDTRLGQLEAGVLEPWVKPKTMNASLTVTAGGPLLVLVFVRFVASKESYHTLTALGQMAAATKKNSEQL